MAILMLTIVFIIVLAIQVPPIVKRKNRREIFAYFFMMSLGIMYSYAYVLDVELPNPTDGIHLIFEPLTKLLKKALL